MNTIIYFLHREDYFPLTLTLSPIGGEGENGTDLRRGHHQEPSDLSYPLSPRFGGRGLG